MADDILREAMKKDIKEYFMIISSPIGMDKLPMNLLTDLHSVMRKAAIWSKSYNADELED
ncbi:hypothetical protein [Desulforhabdus amnigena]|uniref:Uncharacterized protein n=1 Tax=Desulforhabdus amnigena TaxID=40218 RepID=A0A9W6FQV3_9BACT|nr:hypothetical protein [Desulforhabdus amnigena]NLJ27236.1 hypothetical protein [Deltaproteobacteria bacterium]GLI32882.1 hypothetical protein DAMNIGENAA_03150 [Desulforhabdus amnigena]